MTEKLLNADSDFLDQVLNEYAEISKNLPDYIQLSEPEPNTEFSLIQSLHAEIRNRQRAMLPELPPAFIEKVTTGIREAEMFISSISFQQTKQQFCPRLKAVIDAATDIKEATAAILDLLGPLLPGAVATATLILMITRTGGRALCGELWKD